jgi:hypothetical protein
MNVDDRYGKIEFASRRAAQQLLKEQLIKTAGILFPAEGEGRNAIYAATRAGTLML